jgi:predicted membrane protein
MGFVFSGLFWGSLLILVGIAIIIKVVFKIDIPIVRLFFAFFFIYLGISVLVGGFSSKKAGTIAFDDSTIDAEMDFKIEEGETPKKKRDYNIIFGKGTIDLSKIPLADKNIKVEVNTIFGQSDVYIDPDMPIIIEASSAFAGMRMPDGDSLAFGNKNYFTKSFSKEEPYIKIEANVVFGAMRLIEKNIKDTE